MIGIGKNLFKGNVKAGGAVAYDADAAAFFTAANITDTTQKNAVNQLVLDLKSASIWTKMKVLIPVVGGVASSHAVNLKTPGTYNLTFQTGWTHASTGMTPNGATYADTSLIPSTSLTLNSAHISYYSRTNANSLTVDMGNYDNVNNGATLLLLRDSNTASIRMNNLTLINYSNTDSLGLHISNRTASNVINGWKNGIKKVTSAVASTVLANNQIYLGALRDGTGAAYYSLRQCAFASIGDGLSDAEASSFYTAVQTFQTTLGRQV